MNYQYIMIDPRNRLPNVVSDAPNPTLGELLDYVDEGYRVLRARDERTWELIPQTYNGCAVSGIWQPLASLNGQAAKAFAQS